MNFYIMLENPDGSTEEIKLEYGSVYCKCLVCGDTFAPPAIFSDGTSASVGLRCCMNCYNKTYDEKTNESSLSLYKFAAKKFSKVFKVKFTAEEIKDIYDTREKSWSEDDYLAAIKKLAEKKKSLL